MIPLWTTAEESRQQRLVQLQPPAPEPEPESLPAVTVRAQRLKAHRGAVLALALDPHRAHCLASGSDDATVCLWDRSAPGGPASRLSCFGGDAVASVCYSPAGEHEFFAASASVVTCFDLRRLSSSTAADGGGQPGGTGEGAVIARLEGNTDEVNGIAVNPKGRYIAACDDAGELRVFDLHSLRQGRGPPTLFKALKGGALLIWLALAPAAVPTLWVTD
jgi:WD40 repeat protein